MGRFLRDMNPTVRGLLIVALVALVIVVLQLYQTLVALTLIAQVGFLLAIAFFVFLVWRERRSEIEEWSARARTAFYGGAALIVADIVAYWAVRPSGPDAAAFIVVLGLAAFSMVRTWRDQHTYS
jgi:small-conductance mechanosensitive channel